MLVERVDAKLLTRDMLKTVTRRAPTDAEMRDLLFAWAVCRSTKSNTVIAVKEETLIGSDAGQQDRKRCAELCVSKGRKRLKGAVAASDAFSRFPMPLKYLYMSRCYRSNSEPGGSIKNADVIAAADRAGIAMGFYRHSRIPTLIDGLGT